MINNRFICLVIILSLTVLTPNLFAAACNIDSDTLDRGERKEFIICGKDISRNYVLKGLSEAKIKIDYEQYLGLCGIGSEEPGIYLILRAEEDAETASVNVMNRGNNETICGDLKIEVPDRVYIPEASLEDPVDSDFPFKILTIKGNKSNDLSQACKKVLSFPEGKWPSLSLLSKEEMNDIPVEMRALYHGDEPLICDEVSIRALVKARSQQRYPAKVVISKVKLGGGVEKEGISYVMLPQPEWASAMRDNDAKYVDVNGIRTRYFEKGNGEAMLLVHGGQAGAMSNAQNWEQNFDYLSRYFHVYAIDKLGQGYTGNPKKDEDYKKYYTSVVEHVYGFMKAVGIKKVHLVGHSQGGWPVTRISLDHPEMVKSLVVVDSGTTAPSDPKGPNLKFYMYIRYYVDPPEGATWESTQRGIEMWSYSMNNIISEKVERAFIISRLDKMSEADKKMSKYNMSPAHPSYRALKRETLDEIKGGKLKVPTLVIWGFNDPSASYRSGIEFFKYISSNVPEAQLHIFDMCGHYPYLEYPEQFNRLVKGFCGRYTSPTID